MRELQLILACGHVLANAARSAEIKRLIDEGIDWTVFARLAVDHGMATMAAHNLSRYAPTTIPADILDALLISTEQTRRGNVALLEELAHVLDALHREGIEAIPFKGPLLALCAYGDLGLRVFRDLDILVRDVDLPHTMRILSDLGYRRAKILSDAQIEMVQYLQGQDIVYGGKEGTAIEPHTRLTSIKMALDIDYDGLWARSRRVDVSGHTVRLLAPEDLFLVLAIHGGKELWWNIKWACDVAVFLESNPGLDWTALLVRAKAQGCLRMALLAAALAETRFGTAIPERVAKAMRADTTIARMTDRIAGNWLSESPSGPPGNSRISLDRMRLHDGLGRRIRYAARTLFLPTPRHVEAFPLPRAFSFAYVPIRIANDRIALPLWLAFKYLKKKSDSLRSQARRSNLWLAMLLSSKAERQEYESHFRARAHAKAAVAANPNDPTAWSELGDAFTGLEHFNHAVRCYDKSLSIRPESINTWRKREAALTAMGRVSNFDGAPIEVSGDAALLAMRAGYCLANKRYNEAVAASEAALAIDPDHMAATRIGIHARLWACNWDRREDDRHRIVAGFEAGHGLIPTVDLRRICPSERDNFVAAQVWAKAFPPSSRPLWRGEQYEHERIRVGYMSSDLRDHVVSETLVGVLEQHDKTRFETIAISFSPDDRSRMRRRLESAFEQFVDVTGMSDADAARTIRNLEIDILLDLNGYAGTHRTAILAHRPAPLQVSFLGFPGTMGAPFVDYIIADGTVIPAHHRQFYTEHVVGLPHSFMPLDNRRRIGSKPPSRSVAGLPEEGIVFACFNDERKIDPETFRAWMRILQAVEGSVLWLKSLNPSAVSNLRREARTSGLAPDRIIFAPRLRRAEDHLARIALADLFLDTLPYNAHATACDALWAGVPVITRLGEAFPGRVGASILYAAGLPELVTSSLTDYEDLAITLARNPARLAALKAKLARARGTEPLFDTAGYARNLESAFVAMVERQQNAHSPADIIVNPSEVGRESAICGATNSL